MGLKGTYTVEGSQIDVSLTKYDISGLQNPAQQEGIDSLKAPVIGGIGSLQDVDDLTIVWDRSAGGMKKQWHRQSRGKSSFASASKAG